MAGVFPEEEAVAIWVLARARIAVGGASEYNQRLFGRHCCALCGVNLLIPFALKSAPRVDVAGIK